MNEASPWARKKTTPARQRRNRHGRWRQAKRKRRPGSGSRREGSNFTRFMFASWQSRDRLIFVDWTIKETRDIDGQRHVELLEPTLCSRCRVTCQQDESDVDKTSKVCSRLSR